MLTTWTLCLLGLGIAAVLWLRPKGQNGAPLWAWWRTFAAMFVASLAGKVFPDPVAWVLIDLIAAIVVIIPPRAGFQKVIAALFGFMLFLELGWMWSHRMNVEYIVSAGSLFGWLQLAALLTWGIDERYGAHRILDWLVGPVVDRPRVGAR
jgi:hypothetical protein